MGLVGVSYTIIDEKGVSSTTFMQVPDTFSLANTLQFAKDLALLVDAVIGGKITHIGACYLVTLPAGLKANPIANSDVEEGARFSFNTAGGFVTKMRLPTFLESKLSPASKDVNLLDSAVAAFVNAMVAGIAEANPAQTVTPSDGRQDDITSIRTARELFVKDRG